MEKQRHFEVLFLDRPPGVPEGAHVQWEIELLSFETPRVSWSSIDTYHRNYKQLPFLMIPENLVTGLDWVGLPEHHERGRKYQKHGMDQNLLKCNTTELANLVWESGHTRSL